MIKTLSPAVFMGSILWGAGIFAVYHGFQISSQLVIAEPESSHFKGDNNLDKIIKK
jgi:hypothetical protein